MENNEVSKSNKIKIIVITALIFLVSIAGISYAYFTIQITGNDTASSMRLRTANMSLVYNDVQIVSGEYAEPGWTQTKTLTVTNNGNVDADYIIKFRELVNTIINGELVLSATCSASTGTCDNLPERAVHSASTEITDAYMYGPITIVPGVTHTYTLTVLFKETGSNQNYNQNKFFNGTLNIGDGTATDESCFTTTNIDSTSVRITNYDETCGTDLIIPNTINGKTVVQIYNNSFKQKGLTSIIIPSSVTTISGSAFRSNSLTSIIIPDSVTTISNHAFRENQLTSVVIPNNVTTIGDYIFYQNQLTSVVIPNSATTIGDWVFFNNQLTSVVIPNSVTTISDSAFKRNQLTSVVIPNNVTTIGSGAFRENQLTSVVIPNNVTTIGGGAFQENQLTSVVIPSSVTAIQGNTFMNNQLTLVVIPSSVTSIGSSAFHQNQLTSVTIPNSVTSIGNSAFSSNQLTSVTIPSSVTSIGSSAFYQNQLTSVVIPSTVTSISDSAFMSNQLTSVTIEGKSSSSDFTTYGTSIWGWKSGSGCSDATCITWLGSGS